MRYNNAYTKIKVTCKKENTCYKICGKMYL